MTRFDTPAAQAAIACCQMAAARGSPTSAAGLDLVCAEVAEPGLAGEPGHATARTELLQRAGALRARRASR